MPHQKVLNIGTVANDGTGDTLRDAADKINYNFGLLFERIQFQYLNASGNINEDASIIVLGSPSPITVTLLPGLRDGDIKRIVNTKTTTVTIAGNIMQATSNVSMVGKSTCAFLWTGTEWALFTDTGITIN